MTNIKRDIVNKVLSLLYCYNIVCFQDDNIKGWKDGHFSKSVHYSAVGTIKRRLSDSLRVPAVVLGNNIPTTKTCSKCGNIQNMVLSDRIFKCSNCGLEIDKDFNSALNMIEMVGLDRPEVKPVEWWIAARILGSNPCILVSLLQ
jgi:transposase